MKKTCRKCGAAKDASAFYRDQRAKDGLQSRCIDCQKEYRLRNRESLTAYRKDRYRKNKAEDNARCRQYRESHKEQIRSARKRYRSENLAAIKQRRRDDYRKNRDRYIDAAKAHYQNNKPERRRQIREWAKNHPDLMRAYRSRYEERMARNDPRFKLNKATASAMRLSLTRDAGGTAWQKNVGYTTKDLKRHLESLFLDGMSWDNFREWHIDHVIPKSWFSFESTDDLGFKLCWALENLQPMWASENFSKGNRYIA